MEVLQGQQHLCKNPPGQGLLEARAATTHHEVVEVPVGAVLHHEGQLPRRCPEGTEQAHNEGVPGSLQHLALQPCTIHHAFQAVLLAVQDLQGAKPFCPVPEVARLVDRAKVTLADEARDLEALQKAASRGRVPRPQCGLQVHGGRRGQGQRRQVPQRPGASQCHVRGQAEAPRHRQDHLHAPRHSRTTRGSGAERERADRGVQRL
mmetsp:Transcript_64553/g.200140  ORF Transcript_64553/g.200140 Transcript_64553/m.200140 type:complete len:206 (-) Transcript_64553:231-848(-)